MSITTSPSATLSSTPPATPPATLSTPGIPQAIHARWQEAAKAKGFDILARVKDRFHLSIRCTACHRAHDTRINVVRDHQPLCPHCIEDRWRADAKAVGLVWEGRDPEDPLAAFYTAPCGHRLRRQFELIKRVKAGTCSYRCEICHKAKEEAEAEARGWTLLGPDPEGNPNYRLYEHKDCGHQQRIARANMQSGRFTCASCDAGWASEPSFIYAMRFVLPDGTRLAKLGFSRDPQSRLTYQLKRSPDLVASVLLTVPFATGHDALCQEKALHTALKARHPDAVVPAATYAPWINVRSEIYNGALEPEILKVLTALLPS
ncbi:MULTISPECIES: GIY-YIG nuclease family protein [Halocynthiibacter]|uniref:GIY-YIG nuclease family protein n=1 Tax=Halocynthiibacter halioticoli TaxID=2986804 RepID=A0AAE3LTN0_9RHOB|nr:MULTISPECIES: GIY-YIG nuclease family protein [Halocynthiibacter]MCV6825401.1 GIY-YIG nuclease family protein [Halocynthiibacter halioticoli]MCW4058402.1 GIY-YIG nuclease family protein [Halocynthiibacter sp. SDUM655004]